MLTTWSGGFVDSLQTLWDGLANFLPIFLAAIVVLIIGCIIASLIGKLVNHIIRALQIDSLVRKVGAEEYFTRAGIRLDIGKFFGVFIQWFIVIVFLVEALNMLQLTAVTLFLSRILAYVPQVIVAALVLLAGLMIGEALDKIVTRSARAAQLNKANILGTVTRWVIWIFSVLAALYQLGIAAIFSAEVFNGVIIAVSLAVGLAFGLGGQHAAAEFINSVKKDISDKK
jgi:hypothetical protein